METLLAQYREPLFWLFPVATTLIAAGAFLLFALPLTLLAARKPASQERYRIQSRREREGIVIPSLQSWAGNNLLMLLVSVASWPLMRLLPIHAGPLPPVYEIAWQLLFFIFLDDFLYYWMHRGFHTRWLFRRVHSWHHRIHSPWAITGNYMHPVEFIGTATVALAGPALVGAHVVTLWVWMVFRQWEAAEGHCGYAFPWSPTRFLPFSHGAVHHDFHHARVRGNYAGFLPLWDKLFGTCVRDYEQDRAQLKARGADAGI